jgi:hypothetical protein
MTKVNLCYTAHNADSDWLKKEYMMDEVNYIDIIDEYVKSVQVERDKLNMKWEDDSLYLNVRMTTYNPMLFKLIDQRMDEF